MVEMNKERFAAVLAKIESCPAEWDQKQWHCGTTHCFAGHAQIQAGKTPDARTVRQDARVWLGLGLHEANYLFQGSRTIDDFRNALEKGIYNRAGYNRAGYDCDGYNRAGYDCDGYDCYGYNRAGYDSDGYNRYGYNRAGYNRAGYDRAGYDSDGYNRYGYDCDGLNANNEPKT